MDPFLIEKHPLRTSLQSISTKSTITHLRAAVHFLTTFSYLDFSPILNNPCVHIIPYVEPETSKKINHAYLIRQKRWTIFSKNNNPCAGTIRYPRVVLILWEIAYS